MTVKFPASKSAPKQWRRQLDKVAYVRFASVYRDFKDIEEFISEIRTIGAKKR